MPPRHPALGLATGSRIEATRSLAPRKNELDRYWNDLLMCFGVDGTNIISTC